MELVKVYAGQLQGNTTREIKHMFLTIEKEEVANDEIYEKGPRGIPEPFLPHRTREPCSCRSTWYSRRSLYIPT